MSLCLAAIVLFVSGPATPVPQDLFDRWDSNRDGQLTIEELPAALRANFPRVDANADGVISRAEDRAFRARVPAGGGNAAPNLPASVRLIGDVSYIDDGNPRHQLDLLLPVERDADRKLPLVVFVHGGAWLQGNKRGGIRNVLPLVQDGQFVGASLNYRLSGEAIWPAQIHDCKAALRWLKANAEEYGIDPDRIAVWGSSAGGHLVAMLGTSAGVAEMDGELGDHTALSTRVNCVVDFYGPTDFLQMNAHAIDGATLDHDSASSPESRLLGGAIQQHPEKVRTANPITYVSADDPPFLIVHGTRDPLVAFHQSELLHEKLTSLKCDSTLYPVENGGHGGFRDPAVPKLVREFLHKHLLSNTSAPPAEPPQRPQEQQPAPQNRQSQQTVAREWSVVGTVVDQRGNPLPDVTIRVATGIGTLVGGGSGATDANGRFIIPFGPGIRMANNDVQLQVATVFASRHGLTEQNMCRHGDLLMAQRIPDEADLWSGHTQDDIILPGEPRELRFVMLPAAQLQGTLLDADGTPLSGFGISLIGDEMPPSSSVAASCRTDDRGQFDLTDIPVGFEFQVLIEPEKRQPPWRAWASGPWEFLAADAGEPSHRLLVRRGGQTIRADHLELQLKGVGTNWKKALRRPGVPEVVVKGRETPEDGSLLEADTVRFILQTASDAALQ